MGFFNSKQKAETADASQVTATASEPVERQIMRDMVAKLKAAQDAVASAERKVSQLEHAVAVGAKTDEAFKSLDSVEALERIASGDMSNSDVSAMLLRQQAAKTAQDLLPAARQQRDAAQAAVAHLNNQVHTATVNYLTLHANKAAEQYAQAWAALTHAHDMLIGISNALPPAGSWEDPIHTGVLDVSVPGFRLPALGNAYRMDHIIDESVVAQAQTSWQAAVDRLNVDPDAKVGDLFGVAA